MIYRNRFGVCLLKLPFFDSFYHLCYTSVISVLYLTLDWKDCQSIFNGRGMQIKVVLIIVSLYII